MIITLGRLFAIYPELKHFFNYNAGAELRFRISHEGATGYFIIKIKKEWVLLSESGRVERFDTLREAKEEALKTLGANIKFATFKY